MEKAHTNDIHPLSIPTFIHHMQQARCILKEKRKNNKIELIKLDISAWWKKHETVFIYNQKTDLEFVIRYLVVVLFTCTTSSLLYM